MTSRNVREDFVPAAVVVVDVDAVVVVFVVVAVAAILDAQTHKAMLN